MALYVTDGDGTLHKLAGGGSGISGTNVLVDGNKVDEWSADFVENEKNRTNIEGEIVHETNDAVQFAENERQKSKNLLEFPYNDPTIISNGITFTVNDDGSIGVVGTNNGTGGSSYYFAFDSDFVCKAGVPYAFSLNTTAPIDLRYYDGYEFKDLIVAGEGSAVHVFEQDTNVQRLYLRITSTEVINTRVYPQIEIGKQVTDWVFPYGAIVHENDIKRTILTAYLNAWYTPQANNTTYTLPLILYNSLNVNNRLILNSDGTITIGANVKKIKVDATGSIYNNNQTCDVFFFVTKNNTNQSQVRQQWSNAPGYYGWGGMSVPTTIINVKEGDVIAMALSLRNAPNPADISASGYDSPLMTSMTIEVVE